MYLLKIPQLALFFVCICRRISFLPSERFSFSNGPFLDGLLRVLDNFERIDVGALFPYRIKGKWCFIFACVFSWNAVCALSYLSVFHRVLCTVSDPLARCKGVVI